MYEINFVDKKHSNYNAKTGYKGTSEGEILKKR